MAGPFFPSMDPFIEARGNWQDFHNSLIAEMRGALGFTLPADYVARVDERIEVVGFTEGEGNWFRPDVLLARVPDGIRPERPGPGAGLATLEPEIVEVRPGDLDQVRETWLEIRRLPDLELVTVVEVLSPTNKAGPGRLTYLEKRADLHARRINLVEVDLLVGGHPLPMARDLPGGKYTAVVARGDQLPRAEVYRWPLRDPLPTIPVPLRPPDPDASLDLAALAGRVYDLGRYLRTLRYDRGIPEGIPLAPEDRSWADEVAGTVRPR